MKSIIVHLIADISREAGGPARSVTGLCSSLSRLNHDIHLFTLNPTHSLSLNPHIHLHTYSYTGPRRLALSPQMYKGILLFLKENKCAILHSHALWNGVSAITANAARKMRVPHIISPRGMLEPWALKQSKTKKQIARILFQDRSLKRADCLHATAVSEAQSFRQFKLNNPIAIIPNGIYPEEFRSAPPISILDRFDLLKDRRPYILFLSRVHPKKGLFNLISAWHKIHDKYKDYLLVIAGPDELDHTHQLKNIVIQSGLEKQTVFLGPVYDKERLALLAHATIMVLPSFSENFGIVVAESLASRTPVITTHETPWQDLETHRCGWWIPVGVTPLIEAMESALSTPDSKLHLLGENGLQLVLEKYSWNSIANQMSRVYHWLMSGGTPPKVVMTC